MVGVSPGQSKKHSRRVLSWANSQFENRLQLQAVLLLGTVLALSSADRGSLSVIGIQLQQAFHISKTAFGALGTVTTAIGALAALPFGLFVDRSNRTRLLGWCIAIWGLAMILSGIAPDYDFLLASRVLLGIITAVAYPAIASLVGDLFKPAERGHAYGWILSGELIGGGLGILLANFGLSLFTTWRSAEFILAAPAILVAFLVIKMPEPVRESEEVSGKAHSYHLKKNPIYSLISKQRVEPETRMVLSRDPVDMPFWQSMKYVLKVKTNLVIIAVTSLSYFFFIGLQYFALQFVEQHYHISHNIASAVVLLVGIGAVLGVITSGPITDWWLRRGRLNVRIVIPAINYALSAMILAIGIASHNLLFSIVAFFVGAFFFAASNAPLSAARLDIMLPRLWGRAESARTVCQGGFESLAPVTFGLVSDHFFGGLSNGLEYTFLIMLIPMLASAGVMLLAIKTYPRDVATTRASMEHILAATASA